MADSGKGISLVILGIIAILAIVGLVLLFAKAGSGGLGVTGKAAKEVYVVAGTGGRSGNTYALTTAEAGAKNTGIYERPGYSEYAAEKAEEANQEKTIGTKYYTLHGSSTYKQLGER